MSPRLLSPADAAALVAKRLEASWAERVCAELAGEEQPPIECRLRPGVDGSAAVERLGYDGWNRWREAWSGVDLNGVSGVRLVGHDIAVRGVASHQPLSLQIESLEAGLAALPRLGGSSLTVDIGRARRIAARLREVGATVTASSLRAAYRLPDADVGVAVDAVGWLREHSDLTGWTTRQLPVPGMHTKWLAGHGALVRDLVGRDLRAETRPRLSVVHLTYVDPDYLAHGRRRHDAWTTGDKHDLAYRPRTVLVVENRDCRLWFPNTPGTVVVEGAGKAAAAALSGIEWVTGAEHLVYWGDIDCDGFAILNHLRAELTPRSVSVDSILMDHVTHARYAHLGVNRDKNGELLKPSSLRLPHLTEEETACYASVATAGEVTFRRIEQERIPLTSAVDALRRVLNKAPVR